MSKSSRIRRGIRRHPPVSGAAPAFDGALDYVDLYMSKELAKFSKFAKYDGVKVDMRFAGAKFKQEENTQ